MFCRTAGKSATAPHPLPPAMSKGITIFGDDTPCPCGSGASVKECVCKGRHFVPPPVSTTPPSPITGIQVPRCYAISLRDCKPPLTSEHSLSRNILDLLARGGKSIGVSGHKWQKGTATIELVGLSGLGSNVLCKRHNNA